MDNEYFWRNVITINDTIQTEWENVLHYFKLNVRNRKFERIFLGYYNYSPKGNYGRMKRSNGFLRARIKMNPQNEGLLSEMRSSNTEPLRCKVLSDGTVFKGFFTKFEGVSDYNEAIDGMKKREDGKQRYYKYLVEFRLLLNEEEKPQFGFEYETETFYEFMIKNYLKSYCPKGVLARDIHLDKDFPKQFDRMFCYYDGSTIENYMYLNGACYDVIKTFRECWKQYLKEWDEKYIKQFLKNGRWTYEQ